MRNALLAIMLLVGLSCGARERSSIPVESTDTQVEPPVLEIVESGPEGLELRIDQEAMGRWAETAGLPTLPALEAVDKPTYRRFYEESVVAAEDPTAERWGHLGMLYDAYVMPDAALACYRRAYELDPTDFKWPHLISLKLADSGELEESLQYSLEALSLEPRDVAALAMVADLYLRLGRYELARKYYEHYLQLQPDDGIGDFGLARVAEKSGDPALALTHLERCLEMNPNHRPARYLAARVLPLLGREQEVAQHLKIAEALGDKASPELLDDVSQLVQRVARTQNYLRKGLDHNHQNGDFVKALEFASELSERRPNDFAVHRNATWFATALRRYPEAIMYARRAVELDPSFAPGWEAIARGLALSGDNEQALQMVARALEADETFTHARIVRGMALFQLGRTDEAVVDLRAGLADHPDDLDGTVTLALAVLKTGEKSELRAILERILELDPNHAWAREALKSEETAVSSLPESQGPG